MRIVLASSEAVPFAKTGGLADVTTALAKSLSDAGHTVTLVLPYYSKTMRPELLEKAEPSGVELSIPVGSEMVSGSVRWMTIPDTDVPVLLIEQPDYFDRGGLYLDEDGPYPDNSARFIFFSRAVLEACRALVLRPDIIHCNDWQTGLIPALIATEYGDRPGFSHTGTMFTIHNLAYQGNFPHWDMMLTGMDWEYFNWRQMEHFGGLNLLKTGIVFADMVTTVSPTYAWEITTPEGGCGLDGVLGERGDTLLGILNGIDPEVWNPAIDPAIPKTFDAKTWSTGKAVCKSAVQREMGLPVRPDVPMFGMISRMADQKGFDIIAGASEELMELDAQFCFLGTGDQRYEHLVRHLANAYPDRVAAVVGFDEGLAHRIEAGCDAYLMPSRFEPCGLNQMYSLAYGTIPVVRSVGGLKDTVVDATRVNLGTGQATGFRFDDYSSEALLEAVTRAVTLYKDRTAWTKLVNSAITQDFSWSRSAGVYEKAYERAQQLATGQRSPSESETETGAGETGTGTGDVDPPVK
ncbi:glycogen synthase GlgA [Calycomorphotria hydatis]|uniref:Glycogen synthase n=1 Tax=Calycomorphotria hydatis TaxID=2528027 RepID=A0A517T4C5_9PLAN|nr:glycogen synthase GlgA [Calycomorphotria hydatis]QDT63222.1 Glycogen synthase [Calycomorphotria hydatis]